MAAESEGFDVAVVGGGVVGLACAWRLAQRGASVIVLEAGAPGAWQVAAGMLAPVSEAEFGDQALLELGLASARRYADFCAPLEDSGYREVGTLVVARDADEAAALDRLAAFRRSLGLPVERLRPSQARALEGALAPTIRLALDVPADFSVDPRKLVAALERAFTGTVRRARVTGLVVDGPRVTGVALDDGSAVAADTVVIAAGVGVGAIAMPDEARVPVRPVKGQVLRLRDPRGAGLVTRTIRGEHAYLVPRGDGRYVLGATMEERGDSVPTAGGVYELLRDLSEIVPGIFELEISELTAGLRPATPDNLPAIGRGALDGLVWATGHFRNGILLSAVTADLVADLLDGVPLPDWAGAADPLRFAEVPA